MTDHESIEQDKEEEVSGAPVKPALPVGRKQRIANLIAAIEADFQKKAPKATLADFIRLTQLERELEEEEQPGEIIIRWADPEQD